MATATHVKALLESHFQGDEVQFHAVAMQVAAHAARQGQGGLATDIRDLVDRAKLRVGGLQRSDPRARLVSVPKELSELLSVSQPDFHLTDMVLSSGLQGRLARVIHENRQRVKLAQHGLVPRRKLLLMGPPGTGKTLTAAILASELHIPLMRVVLEGLISRFMGETAAKLRIIFEAMEKTAAVYLFDEFDALGSQRTLQGDVGEIRRIVASFLQLVEQDCSASLIVAATNNPQLLDSALFRRFDDVLEYSLPTERQIQELIQNKLATFPTCLTEWSKIIDSASGLSYAELALVCDDAAKEMVLSDAPSITTEYLLRALLDRKLGGHAAD